MKIEFDRFCCRKGAEDVSYGAPFLPEEALVGLSSRNRLEPAGWFPASDLPLQPCVVLLAAPGMGKSTVFERLCREAEGLSKLFVLRDYGNRDALREDLFGDEVFLAWREGDSELELFLDGLDEGLLETKRLHRELLKILARLPEQQRQRLRLRISCRGHHWPPGFTEELEKLWSTVLVAELGPLRRIDVRYAAVRTLGEGLAEEFLALIQDRSLDGLASQPNTLDLMLSGFARAGADGLAQTRAGLYRQGLLHLFHESKAHAEVREPELDQETRIAFGARLAAACVLGNQAGLSLGDRSQEASPWLPIATLDFGAESVRGRSRSISPKQLKNEIVRPGPFLRLSDSQRYRWLNQTHAEFLTAEYLLIHNASPALLRELLVHPFASPPAIVPQLADTASWIAELFPDAWDELRQIQPTVLLRSDLSGRPDSDRIALVEALLEGLQSDRFAFNYRVDLPHLGKLKPQDGGDTEMAAVLQTWLINNSASKLVRNIAAAIARACALQQLEPVLQQIALDTAAPYQLRINTLRALLDTIGDDVTPPVSGFLNLSEELDPDDELLGISLRALWSKGRRWIDTPTLLKNIRPPRRRMFFGDYNLLHSYEIPRLIQDDEIALYLDWLSTQSAPHTQESFVYGDVIKELKPRIVENLHRPSVRKALISLVSDHKWAHDINLGGWPLDWNKPEVQLLAGELVDIVGPRSVWEFPNLDLRARRCWAIERLMSAPTANRAEVVHCLSKMDDPNDVRELLDIASEIPEMREILSGVVQKFGDDPVLIAEGITTSRELRRASYKQHRRPEKPTPDVDAFILHNLRIIEEGEPKAWPDLFWCLQSDAKGAPPMSAKLLHECQRWKGAAAFLQERIVKAAEVYVCNCEPGNSFVDALTIDFLAEVTPSLLAEFPPSVWSCWASGVMDNFNFLSDEDRRAAILAQLREKAGKALAEAIIKMIQTASERFKVDYILRHAELFWVPELVTGLHRLLETLSRESFQFQLILEVLLKMNDEQVNEMTASYLKEGLAEEHQAAVLSAVIRYGAGRTDALRMLCEDTAVGKRTLLLLGERSFITEFMLPEITIWDAILLLAAFIECYPPSEDPSYDGAHFIGVDEVIQHQRDMLAQILVKDGSWAAVEALQILRDEYAGKWPPLRHMVHEARRNAGMSTWEPGPIVPLLKRIQALGESQVGELVVLVESMFSLPELLDFVRAQHRERLSAMLPSGSASLREVAQRYLELLEERGELNEGWFDAVCHQRPLRRLEIRAVQGRHLQP